jgi:hypothetical protein
MKDMDIYIHIYISYRNVFGLEGGLLQHRDSEESAVCRPTLVLTLIMRGIETQDEMVIFFPVLMLPLELGLQVSEWFLESFQIILKTLSQGASSRRTSAGLIVWKLLNSELQPPE